MSEVEQSESGDGIHRGRIRRAAPIATLTARIAVDSIATGVRGGRTDASAGRFHARTAERYAETLGRSKGALMKAGQVLSFASADPVVPSEFRPIYRGALARLQNDAPPMAPELAREVLEGELGRRSLGQFVEFDPRPLAAASIGQVHAARLTDGRRVAVKIQYPGVADAIRSDLKNVELLATLLSVLSAFTRRRFSTDMRETARDLGARILEELDYRLEAANQADFARRYRGHPFIHVPEVIEELCTGRVLTQELRVGRGWAEAQDAEQWLRDSWAEAIWRFVYGSFGRFGMVNIDPNPGNFLFHDDGSVSFLDFGSVMRQSHESWGIGREIVGACIRGEVLATWRLCVEAGYWRASDPITPEEAFAYWREPFRYLWDEQPFTFTPDYAERWIECRCSPEGPSGNALSRLTMPSDALAWPRLEVGLASIFADLRASNDWRSIYAEYSDGQAPVTRLGVLDRAYFDRQ